MTDHWQTIEDALNSERCTIVNLMDGWRNTSATYKRYMPELEAIDAALAFVREQRAGQPLYSHRNGESDEPTTEGYFWAKGNVKVEGELYEIVDCLLVLKWHDGAMLTRLGNGIFVLLHKEGIRHPLGEWSCKWYGPIVPPWKVDTLTQRPQPTVAKNGGDDGE